MTLAAAKKAKKTACAICKPETHFKDKESRCSGNTADANRCKRMTSSKGEKCYQDTAA